MNSLTPLVAYDGFGIQGSILHYGLVIAFVGSALLALLYFWRKGRLDMNEEPKNQMMSPDDHPPRDKRKGKGHEK